MSKTLCGELLYTCHPAPAHVSDFHNQTTRMETKKATLLSALRTLLTVPAGPSDVPFGGKNRPRIHTELAAPFSFHSSNLREGLRPCFPCNREALEGRWLVILQDGPGLGRTVCSQDSDLCVSPSRKEGFCRYH